MYSSKQNKCTSKWNQCTHSLSLIRTYTSHRVHPDRCQKCSSQTRHLEFRMNLSYTWTMLVYVLRVIIIVIFRIVSCIQQHNTFNRTCMQMPHWSAKLWIFITCKTHDTFTLHYTRVRKWHEQTAPRTKSFSVFCLSQWKSKNRSRAMWTLRIAFCREWSDVDRIIRQQQ